MEATTTTFTAEQWARHEQFVETLRAVKQRKRERQTRIEMRLKEEEDKLCARASSCAGSMHTDIRQSTILARRW